MGLLLLIALGLIIWAASSSTRKNTEKSTAQRINQQWVEYLAGHYAASSKPADKAVLGRILADLEVQGMPLPSLALQESIRRPGQPAQGVATQASQAAAASPMTWQTPYHADTPNSWSQTHFEQGFPAQNKTKNDLDNTTILLYFGAFLFVAAAGLFVGFGGATGGLRTATVLVVALAFYFGGLWLYDNKAKLRMAALTFVGIGIALAPLVGVAAYAYVFRQHGAWVWFATSAFCLGLYALALVRLKHPLLEYILIGTFVSLFESTVSIVDGPVYYYGWMLAACGLLLQAWSLLRGGRPALKTSSGLSSHILMPTAMAAALYMIPDHGVLQLGVALLLGAVFYGLHAWQSAEDREISAVAAQGLALLSFACFTYSYRHSMVDVAWVLLASAAVQAALTMWLSPASALVRNAATVGLATAVVAALCGASSPVTALLAIGVLAASGTLTWLRQQRVDAYEVASVALIVASFVYAYAVLSGETYDPEKVVLAAMGVITAAQVSVFYAVRRSVYGTDIWKYAFRFATIAGLVVALAVSAFMGSWWPVATAMAAVAVALVLQRSERADTVWLTTASLFATAPLLLVWRQSEVWLIATILVVVVNLWIVLVHRFEASRWVGTLAWLLLPAAVAYQWQELNRAEYHAFAYLVAAVGLVVARAVARKRLGRLPDTIADLERRLKNESTSYVWGYGIAIAAALISSLFAGSYMPAYLSVAVGILVYLIAQRVERQPVLLGALPVLAQLGLWGSYHNPEMLETFALLSTVLALGGFVQGAQMRGSAGRAIQLTSLATLYLSPVVALTGKSSWAYPAGLLVAATATLYTVWKRPQVEREMAGGLVLLACLWLLYYFDVHNVQVHTHLIAALCGIYAYWRARRGDHEGRGGYITAMLAVATVPLVLQALSAEAGGVYGVWLIGEQIAIMLLGIALKDGFVVRWGLYVAIGAVLYQLRGLGWAMVAVLAVFLIGLALYRLQKNYDIPSERSDDGTRIVK